jgi:hypothetical protein
MKTRWYVIQHSSGLPIGNIYPMTHQEMLAFRRAQMKPNEWLPVEVPLTTRRYIAINGAETDHVIIHARYKGEARKIANTIFAENVICTDDTLLERGSIGIVGNAPRSLEALGND